MADFTYRRESLRGEPITFTVEVTNEDREDWYERWRVEQRKREAEAKAEMAACPYVACTCGHHEDY